MSNGINIAEIRKEIEEMEKVYKKYIITMY